MKRTVRLADSRGEIVACYPLMAQLRTHVPEEEYLAQVLRQQSVGYRLVYIAEMDRVLALAGFRVGEYLAWGKILYVDDWITDPEHRSRGLGEEIFRWLVGVARAEGCVQLHLDSGVQRLAAHRFYMRMRMEISSHHFSVALDDLPETF